MIIADYSQVAIASAMASLRAESSTELSENFIRHMIINMIRRLYHTNKREYGTLVIARDARGKLWRKDVFPYYKSKRKKERDDSFLDWDRLYGIIEKVGDELRSHFPFPVIKVDRAEADDVIATLANTYGAREKVLILSGDHDFIQLHNENVSQYNPVADLPVRHDNPLQYLIEHIIKGDSGDSVPNIISDADTFMIEGKRQRPMTAKRLEEYLRSVNDEGFAYQEAYERNRKLIDLSQIPPDIVADIKAMLSEEQARCQECGYGNILPYMRAMGLRALMQDVGDFVAS